MSTIHFPLDIGFVLGTYMFIPAGIPEPRLNVSMSGFDESSITRSLTSKGENLEGCEVGRQELVLLKLRAPRQQRNELGGVLHKLSKCASSLNWATVSDWSNLWLNKSYG